jgi:hypothetical protein
MPRPPVVKSVNPPRALPVLLTRAGGECRSSSCGQGQKSAVPPEAASYLLRFGLCASFCHVCSVQHVFGTQKSPERRRNNYALYSQIIYHWPTHRTAFHVFKTTCESSTFKKQFDEGRREKRNLHGHASYKILNAVENHTAIRR